jgi:hypothetical protein
MRTKESRIVSVLKIIGLIVSIVLLGLAAFLAHTPWRVHGGRFVGEYMLLAGSVAVVALIVLAVTLRWA